MDTLSELKDRLYTLESMLEYRIKTNDVHPVDYQRIREVKGLIEDWIDKKEEEYDELEEGLVE